MRLARVATLQAALEATTTSSGTETADLVWRPFELQLRRAEAELDGEGSGRPGDAAEPSDPPAA